MQGQLTFKSLRGHTLSAGATQQLRERIEEILRWYEQHPLPPGQELVVTIQPKLKAYIEQKGRNAAG